MPVFRLPCRIAHRDPQEARWIIECLPRGRPIFPYFKDRYAHELLARKAGTGIDCRSTEA